MSAIAHALALELLDALASSKPLTPYTTLSAGLTVAHAYGVSAEVLKLRRARGETPVGRKIGFTNRAV